MRHNNIRGIKPYCGVGLHEARRLHTSAGPDVIRVPHSLSYDSQI